MTRITNEQLAERVDQLERRMLEVFKHLIGEIHRIEDGKPRVVDETHPWRYRPSNPKPGEQGYPS